MFSQPDIFAASFATRVRCGFALPSKCLVIAISLLTLVICTQGVCSEDNVGSESTQSAQLSEFFESKVRPLLIAHCVECHGPDDQSGELRLDGHAGIKAGGGSGPAVVAGHPDQSRLVRAIRYRDNALQMPPDNKLAEGEIEILTRWVREGAYWPQEDLAEESAEVGMTPEELIESQRGSHWAFKPITRVEPPRNASFASLSSPHSDSTETSSRDAAESVGPLDRFVYRQLSDNGLAPNPKADRETLIRRAYFALIGLPPTYNEVQAFLSDDRPDAFEKLVDRLLDNPHYGERWARHWLDIARYGDTKGYLAGSQETRYPFAYTYRDYVIDAFNCDKPFNQFVIEQIAADRLGLAGDERRALAAMGFLTVGRRFGNRQQDIIDDRIDVVTRGFLGLSVACARCHDHKYDAIPTADYYSLYGVFDSSVEPAELPLLGMPEPPQFREFQKAKAEKQKLVDSYLDERIGKTEVELRSRVADYLYFIASSLPQYRKGKISLQGKRGPLRPGAIQRWQKYLVDPKKSAHPVWDLLRAVATIPPEEFAVKATEVFAKAESAADDSAESSAETNSKIETLVKSEPDGSQPARRGGVPKLLLKALADAKPESFPDAARIFGETLETAYQEWTEGRKADPLLTRLDDDDLEQLRQMLWMKDSPAVLDRASMVSHLDQGERNRYNQLKQGVGQIDATHPGAPARGMVMVDKPKAVEPVIFRRGVPSNRGDRVPRRFLRVLSHVDGGDPFREGSGRLELARAIAHPNNPLTARVIVNRVWQHHFGEGLVRTTSDFGIRGESPTHPELLDFLSYEFVAGGWSIKQLQRTIMLSATWQQASASRSDAMMKDPENRLLWHMPRRRLEFEPLRDRLLFASGKLDRSIGGRSVMIHKEANRRALYAYIDREDLPGLLASFDLPSPDASQGKRTETTVPQQALFLMNSPFVISQATSLAERVGGAISSGDDQATTSEGTSLVPKRIRRMYQIALARDPDERELSAGIDFVDRGGDESDEAWVQLAQVLLLCNEFAFVD